MARASFGGAGGRGDDGADIGEGEGQTKESRWHN
jgi:hypothetical protein